MEGVHGVSDYLRLAAAHQAHQQPTPYPEVNAVVHDLLTEHSPPQAAGLELQL